MSTVQKLYPYNLILFCCTEEINGPKYQVLIKGKSKEIQKTDRELELVKYFIVKREMMIDVDSKEHNNEIIMILLDS